MKDDEERVLDERVLDAWPAAEPPEGFADGVLAARRPRRSRRGLAVAAVAAGGLLAAAALLVLALRPATIHAGTIVAAERTEASLGGRAVAVAEPGAALTYRIEGRQARVEQTRGEVFYRVDRGGPFVVQTPAGDVRVKGTCFSVEVLDMKIGKQALAGAAAGALVTAAVFVTVYEGRVLLANPRGATEIRAGERAAAGGGEAPGPAVVVRRAVKPEAAMAAPAPPPDGATREQLLARDEQQRREIAALRSRLATLEAEAQAGGPAKKGEDSKSFIAPTHDELVAMARNCTVQYDTPQLSTTTEPPHLPPKVMEKLGLGPAEMEAVQKAFADVNARTLAALRAIYVEVTGNTAAADDLTGMAMMREIEEKTGRAEVADAMKQLSHERAGLVPPPESLTGRPPAERALRIMSRAGDDLENELGKAIGPDKAHALRAENDGWPARSKMAGCREDDDEPQ